LAGREQENLFQKVKAIKFSLVWKILKEPNINVGQKTILLKSFFMRTLVGLMAFMTIESNGLDREILMF